MKEVIIISSPVTERYVRFGMTGRIDEKTNQIQVNGVWFSYDERWKVKDV
jgi:hypothetical protein